MPSWSLDADQIAQEGLELLLPEPRFAEPGRESSRGLGLERDLAAADLDRVDVEGRAAAPGAPSTLPRADLRERRVDADHRGERYVRVGVIGTGCAALAGVGVSVAASGAPIPGRR